ncbi:protein kinase-like protein rad3 [Amylocarpus encephaloides]|uniref:Serine/threonine-protein kinase MEC1 n=1 Tax=Amylocarpus encephaloides TaxID=45428 RepID=A0A9P8C8Y2_9HELO|nr:protein kinase-like protein rad3 [Amylocarpus encephaloides]
MMALSLRNGVSNGVTNGDAMEISIGGFDAPPSTMAAHLISNLTTTNRPSREPEQDDLKRLMSEISERENSLHELTDVKPVLEHKHKLIYVFTRAVLERLNNDDPFVNVDQLISQASEALDIFMSTIKETPAVLDYVLPPEAVLQARGREPLWAWLFPKVLSLLGRRGCDKLTQKIDIFFYVCFQSISRSPKLWNLSSSFFSYLKECILMILGNLKNPAIIPRGKMSEIVLLSETTENLMSLLEFGSLCTYSIRDIGHAFWHAQHLLDILVRVSIEAAISYDATPAFQNYLAWILDSFFFLQEVQKRWATNPWLQEVCRGSNASMFCVIQSLLSGLQVSLTDAITRKGFLILSILWADILDRPKQDLSDSLRAELCRSLLQISIICRQHNVPYIAVSLHLLPAICLSLEDGAPNKMEEDLQNAAMVLCEACHTRSSTTPELVALNSYDCVELNAVFVNLGIEKLRERDALDGPPSKRRKVRKIDDPFTEIVGDLYALLGAQKASDFAGLSQIAEACFSSLNDDDRCLAIECMSRVPCAAYGTLIVTRNIDGSIRDATCSQCEESDQGHPIKPTESSFHDVSGEVIETFSILIKSPPFLESRRARVIAMLALRKFTVHFEDSNFINLEVSALGQWCLQSLRSSIRELRIAAGRTLVGFLRNVGLQDELRRRNRFNVLELLTAFSENESVHLQETCVLAWSQVGRISSDEELNIVLLQLVKYLGHSNPVISGVAFNEILKLAKSNGGTVERLLTPYWNTVAIEVVQDLLVRPQATQLMADLLRISVSEFLVLTQSHTLPWLVYLGKPDLIKRIAHARKDKQAWLACMETSNMVVILAFLLIQNVKDMENYVMSRLMAVSSQFKGSDFTELMRIDPGAQSFHLLKAAADADESKKSRVYFALHFLAKHAHAAGDGNHAKKNIVGKFLEQHILGLVARLSEVVNDSRDEQPMKEKDRCIKTFEELVKAAKTHTRIARPQICACLQSALAVEELQASSFSAWRAMLMNLEDDDVEAMMESTFSTIIQSWQSFTEPLKRQAEETLQYLLKNRARLIRNTIVKLPSLAQIPELADVEHQISKWRQPTDISNGFHIFSRRLTHENSGVVVQALFELKEYLQVNQSFLQASGVSEQPDTIVSLLVRSILDTCVRFNGSHDNIATMSAECLGLIGCLDSNRVESVREHRDMVVVSNFEDSDETTDFVLFLLEEVIVKAFLSATDSVLQGFLSYVMQELLLKCDFKEHCAKKSDHRVYHKWCALPLNVRNTLTPFLTSKYSLLEREIPKYTYPIFSPESMVSDKIYYLWLRAFVLDLLQKSLNFNSSLIFPPLSRAIRIKDISIASFLLPYVALHVTVLGTDQQRQEIGGELLRVLMYAAEADSKIRREDLKLCIETVFRVLDYLSRWSQEKQAKYSRSGEVPAEAAIEVERVQSILDMMPPETVSQRAVECKSYFRALFYWEQHIRNVCQRENKVPSETQLLERLQDIYTQIDEPDGIEGISAHLHVLDIEQQILGHRKAGRWTAAQSWYEIKLAEVPHDVDVQVNLLTCLKESGQHDVLLNHVESMRNVATTSPRLLPFATEAAWATGRWLALKKYTSMAPMDMTEDFNVRVGQALLALYAKDNTLFQNTIQATRHQIACSLSLPTTASLGGCHDTMLKLHALTELEMIAGTETGVEFNRPQVLASLNRRLEAIGAYLNDKQYLLGIRRAAMQVSGSSFTNGDIASAWLTSARLARKGNATHQSFNAVLHASQLKDDSATIEHARLLWKEGHHRKAIQNLEGAINSGAFISHNRSVDMASFTGVDSADQQNFLTARAHLLLAKWLDSAGQTHSGKLREQYQHAAKTFSSWEKGHYYLGRHYNKLLESDKDLAPEQQSDKCLSGDTSRLVIENYLRSLSYGTKYLYQTLPRIITLWLDLGTQIVQPVDPRHGVSKESMANITNLRKGALQSIHSRFNKYVAKMPAYMFYTALPQIVARIAHPNPDVYEYLQRIIHKVVFAHPQQALWSLLAVCSSTQEDRRARGLKIMQNLRLAGTKKSEPGTMDIKAMMKSGERLAHQLQLACNSGDFHGNRTTTASLSRDLGINQKSCLPSPMAVPVERVLTATLPTLTDNLKNHKAFSRDIVTIDSFSDKVLVLSSLQKPRKLVAHGSDGREYGLMCKPKDDLRKDQRLMEFNSMINRALKRDAEASRRQLYIKTYAVTPLNEECGLIEWVEGLKTLRDILLVLYKSRGIPINYREIEDLCNMAITSKEKLPLFTQKVLGQFPPVFHLWFVKQFPEPSAWFTARLRYSRSCAVMSMVGTILGLGDRHGENILFEEGNGGTFHVDFNCLFEKGLTFAKPERVPFRLTHNMVDAMGMYGYEGPFRKSSELTLQLLRQHQDTLMTILEAFVYDPTLDLVKKTDKRKREGQTAQGVLDTIQRKVKGLLPGESVPLGVEGQVDYLIEQATNEMYLAGMYIGWCSFF